MLTQIYHKQNELFEIEFFKDKECTESIKNWSQYENIYMQLKDGNITPFIIGPTVRYFIPYVSKQIIDKYCYGGRHFKTFDILTTNLSKYIPEDNAVLFLSEEEYNESKISFQNHKIFCHQTGCYGSFEIMDCYNSNECYSESALKYKKLTIFLHHITQEIIQKAIEIKKVLKEEYDVVEVNLFGLHCFKDEFYIQDILRDRNRDSSYKVEHFFNKIITTNSTGILKPQESDGLQVIDCFDIFQDYLKESN
jgi:hypothetical protein